MSDPGGAAVLGPCTPFLIVSDVPAAIRHWCGALGFDLRLAAPAKAPFFAMVGRGPAQLMLKDVGLAPRPNPARHPEAPWDVFILCPEPERLAAEIEARAPGLAGPVHDREDGLRGFEAADPDGHVVFFGHP